jgi:hypothetical protein
MTDLENTVAAEIAANVTSVKSMFDQAVEDGRKLEREEAKQKFKEQANAMMDEVMAVLYTTGNKQVLVEIAETQAFANIKADPNDSTIKISEVEDLLKAVHNQHVEIVVTERDPQLAAIRTKYGA